MPDTTVRPNIVTIVIDDMGWRDLTCYGSTFYKTPNIDALATTGTRFTDAYAAAPVCSPTRASLLTGRYPVRVGVTQFIGGHAVGRLRDVPYFHGLPISEYSLAQALRDGGYDTWHVGKWHLGGDKYRPELHGFEVNIGGGAEGHPPSHFSPYGLSNLDDGPDGEYLTDRLTDEAIELISRHTSDRPFFLNLWHYAVHTPIEAPEELTESYRTEVEQRGLEPEPLETGEPMPTWHQRGERVRRRTEQSHPTYAAMIERLDRSVGRLIECLQTSGRLDNTMIVFTSDNGGLSTSHGSPTCNAPLAEGKGWMADGGVRVPLIVSWPSVLPAERASNVQFTSPDLYPTLLAAAGLEPIADQHCDGVNLWPSWQSGRGDRGPLFWHYPHYSNQGGTPGAAMRDGRYKLIRLFETGSCELYDLDQDTGEDHDLATAEPDRVAWMSRQLNSWLGSVDAQIPRTNPRHPPAEQHR